MMALIQVSPAVAKRCTAHRLARIKISAGLVWKIHRLKLTEDSLEKAPFTSLIKIRSSQGRLEPNAFQSEQTSIWSHGVSAVE
jgi:hypothetical protein